MTMRADVLVCCGEPGWNLRVEKHVYDVADVSREIVKSVVVYRLKILHSMPSSRLGGSRQSPEKKIGNAHMCCCTLVCSHRLTKNGSRTQLLDWREFDAAFPIHAAQPCSY